MWLTALKLGECWQMWHLRQAQQSAPLSLISLTWVACQQKAWVLIKSLHIWLLGGKKCAPIIKWWQQGHVTFHAQVLLLLSQQDGWLWELRCLKWGKGGTEQPPVLGLLGDEVSFFEAKASYCSGWYMLKMGKDLLRSLYLATEEEPKECGKDLTFWHFWSHHTHRAPGQVHCLWFWGECGWENEYD